MCVQNAQTDNLITGFAIGVAKHYANINRTPKPVFHLKISERRPILTQWCAKHVFPRKENGECAECIKERNERLTKEFKERGNQS